MLLGISVITTVIYLYGLIKVRPMYQEAIDNTPSISSKRLAKFIYLSGWPVSYFCPYQPKLVKVSRRRWELRIVDIRKN